MKVVKVDLGARSYEILIAKGLFSELAERFQSCSLGRRVFVVANPTVFDLYGRSLIDQLSDCGFQVIHLMIPDGERFKNLDTVENIYTYLIAQKADRKSTLVALGGGVTGDVVGFVAATFLRGVRYVQLPTTLLAQVDSSVGGKTGVNHRLGKNLIGAFYQPHLVCVDTDTLFTLPEREFVAGLYEIAKYGLIYDRQFFKYFSEKLESIRMRDPEALEALISRCCEIKAEVISIDEREEDLRRILNFGHTLGHALEAATEYERFKHGEAVAYGMLAAAHLSYRVGVLDVSELKEIIETILSVSALPSAADVSFDALSEAMRRDKKREDDQTVFVLLKKIGQTTIQSGFEDPVLADSWARAVAEVEA